MVVYLNLETVFFTGLGFLRIENKWVELQRLKYELEEDNSRLGNQVYALQELLTEKEVDIVRQIERNKDLTNRLDTKCGIFADKKNPVDKMSKHIHAIATFTDSLSEEIERIKTTMDRRLVQFERVHRDIGRLTEGQRLLEVAEKDLEKKVENLADATTHDCRCFNAESLQAHKITGDTKSDTEKEVLAINVASQTPSVPREEDKSKVKASRRKRSRFCGIWCSFRAVIVFLFTFLVTGVVFHFILVSSSLRLPSVPVEEFYGVDLFALWSYFINWLFCLLVTGF